MDIGPTNIIVICTLWPENLLNYQYLILMTLNLVERTSHCCLATVWYRDADGWPSMHVHRGSGHSVIGWQQSFCYSLTIISVSCTSFSRWMWLAGKTEAVSLYILQYPQRGPNRGNIIAGRSIHKQKIERLWRYVCQGCMGLFCNLISLSTFNYIYIIYVIMFFQSCLMQTTKNI